MPGHTHTLKEITALLLAEPLHYGMARDAAFALKALFEAVTGFEESDDTITHIETEQGRAVSPVSAAICIIDYMRTRVFIKGIADAISLKLVQNPGRPVTVLYAGSGPFATLLTPLTTRFGPEQFKMVLLDLNIHSLAYLQRTIDAFDMHDHVLDIVHADATTWQVDPGRQFDIIVSETMMAGLKKEPIVNIFANLVPQCPGAIIIPELIRVDAALYGNKLLAGQPYFTLKTLMELSAATAVLINDAVHCPEILNKGIEVDIPETTDSVYPRFVLLTYIRVFAGHELGLNESGLTLPVMFKNTYLAKDLPPRMLFRYIRGPVPGFQFNDTALL